jgi:hypothetical protein
VLIKNCNNAHVYVFDHSSDVEIVGCHGCEVYVTRPVDGPALLEDCSGCKVVVASQQFQAKRCQDCWFGIYTATGPLVSECEGLKISPWPGEGFLNLDPTKNQFLNVYDASVQGDGPPNFVVRFDPVKLSILDVRKQNESRCDCSDEVPNVADAFESIKAIKCTGPDVWQKTLALIDVEGSQAKNLGRFKSILLSMADNTEVKNKE